MIRWLRHVLETRAVKRTLIREHTRMLVELRGFSEHQAEETCRDLLAKAEEESRTLGTFGLPSDFGDTMLSGQAIDPTFARMVERRRAEGVREEDIRWWWNMHDLERQMMLQMDMLAKTALLVSLVEKGMSPEDAGDDVRRSHPYYGHPGVPGLDDGEDRPIPFEIKDRVNRYTEARMLSDPEAFREQTARFSSVNALIRSEMRAGRL